MNKYSLLNAFNKSIQNRKGVTLTELLAAIAILALVSVPFLGSALSAAKNNRLAEEKVHTSILAQKAMEDIKSRPLLVYSQAGKGRKVYSYNAPYTILYGIVEKKTGVLPSGSSEYHFDEGSIDFNMELMVDSGRVNLRGTSYALKEGAKANKFYLRYKKDTVQGDYSYDFYSDKNPYILSGKLETLGAVNEKIVFGTDGTDKFELHVIVEASMDKDVNIYVADDTQSRMVLINEGEKPFRQYLYSTAEPHDSMDSLYEIEITVNKSEETVNSLVSYVKK
jgi:prepilin-type N-terminal cleavage/methylation domain-containing protein